MDSSDSHLLTPADLLAPSMAADTFSHLPFKFFMELIFI